MSLEWWQSSAGDLMSWFKRVYGTCRYGNSKELRVLVPILIDSSFISCSFSTLEGEIFIGENKCISYCIARSSRLAYEIISDFNRTGLIYQEKYNSCKVLYVVFIKRRMQSSDWKGLSIKWNCYSFFIFNKMSHIITVTSRVFFIKSNDFKVQHGLYLMWII